MYTVYFTIGGEENLAIFEEIGNARVFHEKIISIATSVHIE